MKKYITKIITILTCSMLGTVYTYACSCMPRTTQERFNQSDAVFIGKVIKVDRGVEDAKPVTKVGKDGKTYIVYEQQQNLGMVTVTLEVKQAYKGLSDSKKQKIIVQTSANGAMCGVGFSEKKSYIVYAIKEYENVYSTNLCLQTQECNNDELKELNKVLHNGKEKKKFFIF